MQLDREIELTALSESSIKAKMQLDREMKLRSESLWISEQSLSNLPVSTFTISATVSYGREMKDTAHTKCFKAGMTTKDGNNLSQAQRLADSRALLRGALLREMHIDGVMRGRRGFALRVCVSTLDGI